MMNLLRPIVFFAVVASQPIPAQQMTIEEEIRIVPPVMIELQLHSFNEAARCA